eukprot:comp12511_c1_seq1/m.7486 comp12511_c1_seq1/g.7486  ORF comp12511_c1_seq1/g.7486 comp12511_c1_seq1/m.7486 type:complete len:161 (-) comp12511_c1_seq1:200-682(-)
MQFPSREAAFVLVLLLGIISIDLTFDLQVLLAEPGSPEQQAAAQRASAYYSVTAPSTLGTVLVPCAVVVLVLCAGATWLQRRCWADHVTLLVLALTVPLFAFQLVPAQERLVAGSKAVEDCVVIGQGHVLLAGACVIGVALQYAAIGTGQGGVQAGKKEK